MNIKTLEALAEFVSATRSAFCTSTEFGCENSELDEAASELEGELERELLVKRALKQISGADDKLIFTDLPEFLKRQSS